MEIIHEKVMSAPDGRRFRIALLKDGPDWHLEIWLQNSLGETKVYEMPEKRELIDKVLSVITECSLESYLKHVSG
jgi:hypothetical protein